MPSDAGEACANPLLLGWLKESYDIAKERNTKAVHAYKKAYQSMKACPLTFSHPSEASQLDGIGEKLCSRLTEQLERYCQANGLPMPEKARGNTKKRLSGDEDTPELADQPANKKARKPKPYVPTRGSGSYAILIALSTLPEHSTQSLTRAQLIELAQPYCASSFTVGDAGKMYTAWKSMTTLVNKDLVQERGRPLRRYALTEEGWETARKMRAVEKGQIRADFSETTSVDVDLVSSHTFRGPEERTMSPAIRGDPLSGAWGFQAGDSDVRQAQFPREAAGAILPAPSDRMLGAAPVDQSQTFTRQLSACDGPTPSHDIVDLVSSPEPPSKQIPRYDVSNASAEETVLQENCSKLHSTDMEARMEGQSTSTTSQAGTQAMNGKVPEFTPITLQPGSFSIKLLLDSREKRRKFEDGNWISHELAKQNTPNIRRALPLGDALWVAEIDDETILQKCGESVKMIVLDWIVERKRLDDLVSSIVDGRFQEQKSRLWRSGIRNVTYLIEEFALSTDTVDKFGQKIASAIASTQVLHGYFVKQTGKIDDSLRYLSQMTASLRSVYESQPLHIIPSTAVDSKSYLQLRDHLRTAPEHKDKNFGMTMNSFEALASKSDALTLRDVFLKMLMCTRGISADKALSLQKVWYTPRELIESYERCKDQSEREKMVERELGGLVRRSAIKGILSTKVADIWGKAS